VSIKLSVETLKVKTLSRKSPKENRSKKRGSKMVQFLYETTVEAEIEDVIEGATAIYNARLKVDRICGELDQLADHGITLPPNMQGLADEQIADLKLVDDWAEKCEPQGGWTFKKDDIGRRNGRAPNDKMAEMMKKTKEEAKTKISKKLAESNQLVTLAEVKTAMDLLRGAVMIVYPMGLPPHDPIKMEFDDEEDLEGTQASKDVIPKGAGSLWWAGKELQRGKKLSDFVGKNEKTKITAKLQRKGVGPPSREQVFNEEEKKKLMANAYKRQEEIKKLNEESSESYMDSDWADTGALKRSLMGISEVKLGPKFK